MEKDMKFLFGTLVLVTDELFFKGYKGIILDYRYTGEPSGNRADSQVEYMVEFSTDKCNIRKWIPEERLRLSANQY